MHLPDRIDNEGAVFCREQGTRASSLALRSFR